LPVSCLISSSTLKIGALYAFVREVFGMNFHWDTDYPNTFHGFLHSFHSTAESVPQLGHEHFLPSTVQFIIHLSFYNSRYIV
jgi:hypothetical protein